MSTTNTPSGRALLTPPPVCLVAVVPSGTRDNRQHAVMRAVDGSGAVRYGCTCEAGCFRPDRECVHVREFRAGVVRSGAIITAEGHVVLRMIAANPAGLPDGWGAGDDALLADSPAESADAAAARLDAHTRQSADAVLPSAPAPEVFEIPGSDATFNLRSRMHALGGSYDRERRVWSFPAEPAYRVARAMVDSEAARLGPARGPRTNPNRPAASPADPF